MKDMHDKNNINSEDEGNATNGDGQEQHAHGIGKPSIRATSRRSVLYKVFAVVIAGLQPCLVTATEKPEIPSVQGHIDPAPNWVPKSLEQRIAGASFIFIGVPTRFRYLPDDAYKKFRLGHDFDPEYLRLQKNETASHADFRKYFDANPGDPVEFRLHDEWEKIEGTEIPYLEFDLEHVIFKRGPPSNPDMGTNGKRLYFRLGGEFRMGTPDGDRMRGPWTPYFGKRVILLSEGYTPSRSSIRMPFSEQTLAAGPHFLDRFPILLSELPQVISIANRLGFVSLAKP